MSVFIAPNASIMGDVKLGTNVSIWYGAVLRGDTETLTLGEGTNIQDNAVVHADPGFPTILGKNVTVGHSAIVHGAIIGDGTMIGMGSTILNGAKIGKNCLIGANALVKEGMEVPDNSMVLGMPAKIIRELKEEELNWLSHSAPHYIAMSKRHQAGEFPLLSEKDFE
ncbi:MAG: hypothetical protein RIR51_2068 [Bacteroidota bacterium]|jgi:carbonic anhydrase/acetyltransferase-like protein (isoleucine patch superfamily)